MTEGERKATVYGSPYPPERRLGIVERNVLSDVTEGLWEGWGKSVRAIRRLSDKKLWQLREALEALGQGNCGWIDFRMKSDLLHEVECEVKAREVKQHVRK